MNIRYPIYEGVYRILTIKIEKGGTPFSIFFIFVSILQKTQL